MSRIRKQPRRSTKKVCQPIFKNIFGVTDEYEPLLPIAILSKLRLVEQISINNLQQFIAQPHTHEGLPNLAQMRQALTQQRARISSLHIHEDFERMEQLQTQEQIRQETKKTAHSLHQYPASELLMLNSQDDNIFFHQFGDDEHREVGHRHDDFMAMDGRLTVNEDIDILSLIN